ncbi:hypothetical protein AAG906_008501 [Vitis piasezkii]
MPLYCFHIPPTTLNPSHFHQKSHKILGTHNEKRVLASRKISHAAHSRISPLWTVDEIAEAVNGTIVQRGPPGPICTDTRTLEPGQWFFAIRGENFDAHEFITPELGHKGCVGVIGNWVCLNWDKGFVEMGVCLSLIGIPQNVGFVVLELGMDRRGEIMELARMARPSIRVILNVGVLIWRILQVLFGQRLECDVRFAAEKVHGVMEFEWSAFGSECMCDCCSGSCIGVSLPQVGISLSRFIPVSMRSELEVAKLASKLSMMFTMPTLKRVAILGDMLELGQAETVSHEMMLSLCCDSHFDLIALVGKRFLRAAENLNLVGERNLLYSPDAESLAFEIVQRLNRNDVILVKGSRGMQMEKVVAAIKAMNLGFPHE